MSKLYRERLRILMRNENTREELVELVETMALHFERLDTMIKAVDDDPGCCVCGRRHTAPYPELQKRIMDQVRAAVAD